jgi:hypothetical protein
MDEGLKLFGVLMALVTAGGAGYALVLVVNAVARRLGMTQSPAALPDDRMADLEARVAQIEDVAARLGDLEERVDFVERRLVEGTQPRRLDG